MLEPQKIKQIIAAWLGYIKREELASAAIEKGQGRFQKVFTTGVRLVGNQLLLDCALFKQLKQQGKEYHQRGLAQDFSIAVAGPVILGLTH